MTRFDVCTLAVCAVAVAAAAALTGSSCKPSSPVTAAQHRANVERATDALCAVRAQVKALGFDAPAGPRADLERGTDVLCAARAAVRELEAQDGSAGAS